MRIELLLRYGLLVFRIYEEHIQVLFYATE
jgi:hypothetical protein